MTCNEICPQLMDYARQRLSAAEAGAVDNHLGGCRNCVALLEQERSLCLVLESVPSVRARGDIWLAVRARRAAVALPASMAQARPCAISVRRSAWRVRRLLPRLCQPPCASVGSAISGLPRNRTGVLPSCAATQDSGCGSWNKHWPNAGETWRACTARIAWMLCGPGSGIRRLTLPSVRFWSSTSNCSRNFARYLPAISLTACANEWNAVRPANGSSAQNIKCRFLWPTFAPAWYNSCRHERRRC
jgi:hypothetical protein